MRFFEREQMLSKTPRHDSQIPAMLSKQIMRQRIDELFHRTNHLEMDLIKEISR